MVCVNEWRVVWVPDPARWGTLPADGVLGIKDLPSEVARIGLQPGDPVFVTPDATVDLALLEFVLSPGFRRQERETKRNYGTDIRLLLNFLSSREVPSRQATEQDLTDYRVWRCEALENPERISGTKWNREAAALTKLYRWAGVTPLPVDARRREDRAADSVSSRVSWLTPRTWGLWSDIGLRGHTRNGCRPRAGMRGPRCGTPPFVQLLLSSGLRRQEGASLLTLELPTQALRHGRYRHGQVAGAVTRSKKDRTFYVSVDALDQVESYVQSERAWAVQRAQEAGRYDRMPELRLMTGLTRGMDPKLQWVDRNGVHGEQRLRRLGWRERQWLFLEGPEGPEPAWLWLTEQGVPMLPDRWEGVFRSANSRCEQALLRRRFTWRVVGS
ncbi:site-specific integrase [Streptomyces sp. NPDC054804]